MKIRWLACLLAVSLVLTGCHDAAAELLHGSGANGDACCTADAGATGHAHASAAHADALGGCCAACVAAPECICDGSCSNCAECPICDACGDCGGDECCAMSTKSASDPAKEQLEELAPAQLQQDG